jgi:hypothetical protein
VTFLIVAVIVLVPVCVIGLALMRIADKPTPPYKR